MFCATSSTFKISCNSFSKRRPKMQFRPILFTDAMQMYLQGSNTFVTGVTIVITLSHSSTVAQGKIEKGCRMNMANYVSYLNQLVGWWRPHEHMKSYNGFFNSFLLGVARTSQKREIPRAISSNSRVNISQNEGPFRLKCTSISVESLP